MQSLVNQPTYAIYEVNYNSQIRAWATISTIVFNELLYSQSLFTAVGDHP